MVRQMSRIGSWMELEPSSHIIQYTGIKVLLQPGQRKFIYSESPSQLTKYVSGKDHDLVSRMQW